MLSRRRLFGLLGGVAVAPVIGTAAKEASPVPSYPVETPAFEQRDGLALADEDLVMTEGAPVSYSINYIISYEELRDDLYEEVVQRGRKILEKNIFKEGFRA